MLYYYYQYYLLQEQPPLQKGKFTEERSEEILLFRPWTFEQMEEWGKKKRQELFWGVCVVCGGR